MQTHTDSQAKRAIIGLGVVILLALASVGGATAYECRELFVAEIEADIERLNACVCHLEALAIAGYVADTWQWSAISDAADRLECRVTTELAIGLVESQDGGSKAAGTRVRKQMQKIKQAAQEVRNRVLGIRSASSTASEICEIPVFMKVGMYVQMTSGPTAMLRTQANRRSTVKAQDL